MSKHPDERAALLATRRQILAAGAAVGAAMLLPRIARAASVPFNFECDRQSAFVMDPNQHRCFGYLTAFNGVGTPSALPADLAVSVPWNAGQNPTYTGLVSSGPRPGLPSTAKVVGVIEKFSWNGGVGDAITIDFYVSQQNAVQLKTLQQSTLKNSIVKELGWWIADYDQETKLWYEKSYPTMPATVSGIVGPKDNPRLDVNLSPVVVKAGIDVNIYKVSLAVTPTANKQYSLHFANAPAKPLVKSWGLVVGTLGAAALPQ